MPDYAGPIKFPVPADRYNTAYGEPQWWKELAETAAAAISAKADAGHSHSWAQITGKPSTFAPSAHTHSALTSGTFSADLSSAGAFALRSGSTNMVQWNAATGALVAGSVPWARITGAPVAHSERLELGSTVFKLNPAGGFEHHAGGSRRWLVNETGTLIEGAVPPARVSGLADRLAALEYKSGRRKLTSLIPGVVSGDLFALRNGPLVSLEFSALKLTPSTGSFIDLGNVLPTGFRISGDREYLEISQPSGTGAAVGPIRLRNTGALLIYGAANGEPAYGTVTYQTIEAPPATPPGSAA